MLRRIGLVVFVLALACPATASAGGYATVGLQSVPGNVEPGEPWMAEFTVLAHGRTPFVDGRPSVTVTRADGRVVGTYPARLVNQDGLYRAAVVFPGRGRFEYVIDDGYSQRHTFPPVTVGADGEEPAAPLTGQAEEGSGEVPLALALAAGAGLLAGWIVLMVLSRRTRRGEPALEA
ncbi:MAG TPA: hypothetical protein VE270_02330 [Thermoleophilaceae bacterium]|nr:hypothetical protein [Thermoleophilaceae bacterium]